MIRIHYVPPSANPTPQAELPPLFHDALAPRRAPFESESATFTRGTPSRLGLDEVGLTGRARRNQRDALLLSAEWRSLRRLGVPLGQFQILQDATTALGPDGRPNAAALKQARAVLRQWFDRNRAQLSGSAVEDAVRRLDGLLGRMVRRNLPFGDAGGQLPPIAERPAPRTPTGLLSWPKPKSTSAAALHKEALALERASRFDEALSKLERACELVPDSARLHFDRGRMLAEEGHFLEAEWALLQADELKPDVAAVQAALGDVYAQMGAPEMAEEAFKRAIKLDPRLTDAHTQLGVHYYESGAMGEAAQHLQRAVQLDPEGVVGRYYLAQIALQENDVLRARYQLEMVRKIAPHFDMRRFAAPEPAALARQAQGPEAAHHWKVPRSAP